MAIQIEIAPETDRLVRDELSRGHFHSVDEVIQVGVEALRERERVGEGREDQPFWKSFTTRMHALPEQVFAELPVDGASEHDHYIHGTPRKNS